MLKIKRWVVATLIQTFVRAILFQEFVPSHEQMASA